MAKKFSFSLEDKLSTTDLLSELIELWTPQGLQASKSELFQGAVFGRDSVRVAMDLLPWFPNLSEKVIISLLRLQGTETNPITEEEEGRIHHEYRHLFLGGQKVRPHVAQKLVELGERWGGSSEEVIYYGSVDATPQLIRLVDAHIRHNGPDILDTVYVHRTGALRSVRDGMLAATRWTAARIGSSDLQLLEFRRTNPNGITWQVLRDGGLSYLHEDGTLANANAPIASIDVQGIAYDALMASARVFTADNSDEAAHWRTLAHTLQQATITRFWNPDTQSFAMAIDRDTYGVPRQVTTLSSLQSELLETNIFDALPPTEKQTYIQAIIRHMYSNEFLTPVGIRSRAVRHQDLVPYWDYQGANVSWTVMSNIFAIGLRKQGFIDLAKDMENRMLNAAMTAGDTLEFYYVTGGGRVNYFPLAKERMADSLTEQIGQILGTNIPESHQAWTISALLRILLLRKKRALKMNGRRTTWHKQVEQHIWETTPKTKLFSCEQELIDALLHSGPFHIDRAEGLRLEAHFLDRWHNPPPVL